MRVLVVTVVHHPLDARVWAREIGALLAAGHQVTYAAPWSATATSPGSEVAVLDLPRAHRRRRMPALRAARRLLREQQHRHDLVILHDPELLLALPRRRAVPFVWDVHEDPAAALVDKTWLPAWLRSPLTRTIGGVERRAERSLHLLLAEEGYQRRFHLSHPIVPNEPVVPETVSAPGADRVLYVGRISVGRGGRELVRLADLLPAGVSFEVIGDADREVTPELRAAAARGVLRWDGRLENRVALARIDGATAGLSLLHDLPNYRHSRPTKVVEYMARGVPVITTPSPVAATIVEEHDCGVVVPFGDPGAAAEALARLVADPDLRHRLGRNGHRAALEHFNWARSGPRFVSTLERWAVSGQEAGAAG